MNLIRQRVPGFIRQTKINVFYALWICRWKTAIQTVHILCAQYLCTQYYMHFAVIWWIRYTSAWLCTSYEDQCSMSRICKQWRTYSDWHPYSMCIEYTYMILYINLAAVIVLMEPLIRWCPGLYDTLVPGFVRHTQINIPGRNRLHRSYQSRDWHPYCIHIEYTQYYIYTMLQF